MTLWGLPARRSPVRCFLWNLIAILAGGARRGQSRTPLCPHGAVELTAPPGDRNLRVFLIPSRFSQIGAIRDAAILPTFHVAFGPLAIPEPRLRASSAPYLAHQRMGAGMRVAVIGTGIAGNAAAWTLSKRYPVTVYDRELRPGGHSHTVSIVYNGFNEADHGERVEPAHLRATPGSGARHRPDRQPCAAAVLSPAARLHVQPAVGLFCYRADGRLALSFWRLAAARARQIAYSGDRP